MFEEIQGNKHIITLYLLHPISFLPEFKLV